MELQRRADAWQHPTGVWPPTLRFEAGASYPICYGKFDPPKYPCDFPCPVKAQCQVKAPEALHPIAAVLGWTLKNYRDVARRSSTLTAGEYRVLDALLSFADWSLAEKKPGMGAGGYRTEGAGGNCFPPRKQIAARCGRNARTIDPILTRLERKGWIARIPFIDVRRGCRAADLFWFRIPQDVDDYEEYAGVHGPLDWSKRKDYERPAHRGHELWTVRLPGSAPGSPERWHRPWPPTLRWPINQPVP